MLTVDCTNVKQTRQKKSIKKAKPSQVSHQVKINTLAVFQHVVHELASFDVFCLCFTSYSTKGSFDFLEGVLGVVRLSFPFSPLTASYHLAVFCRVLVSSELKISLGASCSLQAVLELATHEPFWAKLLFDCWRCLSCLFFPFH